MATKEGTQTKLYALVRKLLKSQSQQMKTGVFVLQCSDCAKQNTCTAVGTIAKDLFKIPLSFPFLKKIT